MSLMPRSTPEAQGVRSNSIVDFIAAADAQLDCLHSLMILRHGTVIAEGWWDPYAPQHPHLMFSVSKSFTSTAVGLAISEGRLTLDDRVIDLLPDDMPANIDANLAALTVRHLLTMTTGHAADTVSLAEESPHHNWSRAILAQVLEFTPGTQFVYNSGATYLLSAILQRLTGDRLLDYLTPRLFSPLGIVDATWLTCPRGIDAGGWGLSLTTEQLATFGQLLLQRGRWNGDQLVPAAWIDEASALQVDTWATDHDLDGRQGYGYQYWRNSDAGYRADGAFAQLCVVLPEQDAVVVMTAGIPAAQPALDLVWKHLLPAFNESAQPIAAIADDLQNMLTELSMAVVSGQPNSAISASIEGVVYSFPHSAVVNASSVATADNLSAIRSIVLNGNTLTLTRDGGEHIIAFGCGGWADSPSAPDGRTAASGAWISPSQLVVRVAHIETPFVETYDLTFSAESDAPEVTLGISPNVAFGEITSVRITGRAQNYPQQARR